MRRTSGVFATTLLISLSLLLTGIKAVGQGQERMTIQATAMGTSTQMGRGPYNVNIIIEQFSTPADQKALIEAFKRSGQDGLVNVLEDMRPKGRVRFASGGVGNDVKYIIELPSDKGRRFRLVTDRYLSFGALYYNPRSNDYNVGAIELTITPDGKGSGTVLPACRLTMDKKTQEVEIETYQNPWNLSNFIVSND